MANFYRFIMVSETSRRNQSKRIVADDVMPYLIHVTQFEIPLQNMQEVFTATISIRTVLTNIDLVSDNFGKFSLGAIACCKRLKCCGSIVSWSGKCKISLSHDLLR